MNNWRRVDEIISYYGKGVTPKYVKESSIIVLNQKCIRNNNIDYSFARYIDDSKTYSENKLLKEGDVLINSTGQGTAGRVAFLEKIPKGKKVIVDSHILVLRTNDYWESKCLNYSLYSIEPLLQTFLDGSTGQGEFDKLRMFNVEVNYSQDSQDQRSIAKVLSDLDAKIELNNKINAELEAMAKLTYDYWFVQFDFPNKNGKPYKSSGGKMVYNEELKREIPEGWEVKRLEEIANITTGKLDSNAEVENGSYHFYTCASEPTRTDSFAFDDSVILIAGNNAAGNFHVNRYTGKFNAYQRTYIVTAKEEKYLNYLYQILVLQMKLLKKRGKGSQTKFITLGMLTETPIFDTNSEVIDAFHKISHPMYEKQMNILNENQKLAELRDWLLPMLMNGQVKVGEAKGKVQMNMAAESDVQYNKG